MAGSTCEERVRPVPTAFYQTTLAMLSHLNYLV